MRRMTRFPIPQRLTFRPFDSLTIEFGIFIDFDQNGFDSGDSLGAWNNGGQNFTPFSVQRGSVEADRNVLVRFRRP
jgi:hypothetical protein